MSIETTTEHDWLQIEQAASGCVSGTSDDWPALRAAIAKITGKPFQYRKSADWLQGFCEGVMIQSGRGRDGNADLIAATGPRERCRSVFAFEFGYCRFESGFEIYSLHLTKAGAYRAMMTHKCNHWHDARESQYCHADEIGWMELWRVKEYTIAD